MKLALDNRPFDPLSGFCETFTGTGFGRDVDLVADAFGLSIIGFGSGFLPTAPPFD